MSLNQLRLALNTRVEKGSVETDQAGHRIVLPLQFLEKRNRKTVRIASICMQQMNVDQLLRIAHWQRRRTTASTTLKIAVFAPMPRAKVRTATAVKPGLFASIRQPYRMSCSKVSICYLVTATAGFVSGFAGSLTIQPSSSWIVRSLYAALASECVT